MVISPLMVNDSQSTHEKMETGETEKKRNRDLIFQFQTTHEIFEVFKNCVIRT